jgi:tetratricopeptide (TPR) repeat protein
MSLFPAPCHFAAASLLCLLAISPAHAADPLDATVQQAHQLLEQGKPDVALPLLDKVLASLPQHAAARFNRGQILLGQGLVDAALADFDLAVAGAPLNPRYLGARCVARVQAGQVDAGLADCATALAQPGSAANALVSRGQARLLLKRDAEALADFDAALQANPQHMRALYGKGIALARLGAALQRQAVHSLPGAGRDYRHPAFGSQVADKPV